jgi:VWFA-related protein
VNRSFHEAGLWLMLAAVASSLAASSGQCDGHSLEEAWLSEHSLLLAEGEPRSFRASDPAARAAFIASFWRRSGADSRFVATWYERIETARQRYGDLDDPRARAILVLGRPAWTIPVASEAHGPICGLFVPFEASLVTRGDEAVYFVAHRRSQAEEWELWNPDQGLRALIDPVHLRPESPPSRDPLVRRALALLARQRPQRSTIEELLAIATTRGCFTGAGHVARRLEEALARAAGPGDLDRAAAALRQELRGRASDRAQVPGDRWRLGDVRATVLAVEGPSALIRATIPVSRAVAESNPTTASPGDAASSDPARSASSGRTGYSQLHLRAEWCSERGSVSVQHTSYWVPIAAAATELVLVSRLPVEHHELALRLVDGGSGATVTARGPVELVPQSGGGATAAAGLDRVVEAQPLDALEVSWSWDPVAGAVHAEAAVFGSRIAAVRFELGAVRRVVDQPPFRATLPIRGEGRQALIASGLDSRAAIVAGDRSVVAPRPLRPSVRIVRPSAEEKLETAFWVQAAVEAPADQAPEGVEIWLGDRLLAMLESPPWLYRVDSANERGPQLLRVVARLPNGGIVEDARLLDGGRFSESLQVRLHEHWLVVEDADGAPVDDLAVEDLEVRSGRERVEDLRLLPAATLPLDLLLLVDTSTTMLANQARVRAGLDDAVGTLVGERDRVALLEFDAALRTAVPFTNDLAWLREGIGTLDSAGGTALYDAVAGAVAAFHRTAWRRAILLVSDGLDRHSRLDPETTVRVVQRSGIPVYVLRSVSAGMPFEAAMDTSRGASSMAKQRNALALLAHAAGGRLFDVSDGEALERALEVIREELAAQYLLSITDRDVDDGRKLSVRILRPGRHRVRLRAAGG